MTDSKPQEIKIQKFSDFSRLQGFESWQCRSRMLRDMEINYSFLICVTLTHGEFLGLNVKYRITALTLRLSNFANTVTPVTKTTGKVQVLLMGDERCKLCSLSCPE